MSGFSLRQATAIGMMAAAGFAGWACSPSSDDAVLAVSEQLQDTNRDLANMGESVKGLQDAVGTLQSQMVSYNEFVTQGGGLSQDQLAQLTDLKKKVVDLEQALAKTSNEVQQLSRQQADLQTLVQRGGRQTQPAETTVNRPGAADSGAATTPVRPRQPEPEAKQVGYYYPMKAGETLESVAEANSISIKELREANPGLADPNRKPIGGQPIWIPREPPKR